MFKKKSIKDLNVQGKKSARPSRLQCSPQRWPSLRRHPHSSSPPPPSTTCWKTVLPSFFVHTSAAPKAKPNPNSLSNQSQPISTTSLKRMSNLQKIASAPPPKKLPQHSNPVKSSFSKYTRYYAGEKKNDPEMAKTLASYADLFVNDAFGTAHRAHASTVGVASYLPAVAGFLLEKEIEYLGNAVAEPTRPFVAILGGAKVSDKIEVIKNLLTKADKVLIGGGMANTFFKAQGYTMGSSLVEEDALDTAKELLATGGDKLCLPVDMVIADKFGKPMPTPKLSPSET